MKTFNATWHHSPEDHRRYFEKITLGLLSVLSETLTFYTRQTDKGEVTVSQLLLLLLLFVVVVLLMHQNTT